MNIGIDIRSIMYGKYSGVGIYTYNLLQNLFKIDKENQYFLFANSYHDITQNLSAFKQKNVMFCNFQWPNKVINLCMTALNWPKIDLMVEEYANANTLTNLTSDTVELDLFFTPNWLFSAFSPTCKRVITIHDLSIFLNRESYSLKQKAWHRLIKIKKLVNDSHTIICVSKNTLDDVKKILKISDEKLILIPEGVEQKYQLINDIAKLSQIKKKYSLPDRFILTLSNIEPRKNILGTIISFEHFKKLSNDDITELAIGGQCGWNGSSYYHKVRKYISQSPFHKQIRMLGYVGPKDLPYIYNLANLFVFPTFYEGFGLPVLEAMACEIPVITSFCSSLPEIVEKSAILIDPNNHNDIARAINEIINNKPLRDVLIQSGRKQASLFTWEKTAKRTLEAFQQVASPRSAILARKTL